MPLTFNPGETKTFQLQAESYKAYPRHWVGREYKPCSGLGCALCVAGIAAKQDYMIPIAIAGTPESWVFPPGVAQQLDSFIQQGYKLLGLKVKVSRSADRQNTRYQVIMASESVAAAPPAPVAGFVTPAQVLPQVRTGEQFIDSKSFESANLWARLTDRLLMRKDFLDLIASEVQLMKDEGLWQ